MGNGRMQFDMELGRAGRSAKAVDEEEPFRILILGDLSGRSTAQRTPAFAQRVPIGVDVDNLDTGVCATRAAIGFDSGWRSADHRILGYR